MTSQKGWMNNSPQDHSGGLSATCQSAPYENTHHFSAIFPGVTDFIKKQKIISIKICMPAAFSLLSAIRVLHNIQLLLPTEKQDYAFRRSDKPKYQVTLVVISNPVLLQGLVISPPGHTRYIHYSNWRNKQSTHLILTAAPKITLSFLLYSSPLQDVCHTRKDKPFLYSMSCIQTL